MTGLALSYAVDSDQVVSAGEIALLATAAPYAVAGSMGDVAVLQLNSVTATGSDVAPYLAMLADVVELTLVTPDGVSAWSYTTAGTPSKLPGVDVWQLFTVLAAGDGGAQLESAYVLQLPLIPAVVADLSTLKRMLGQRTDEEDQQLSWALSTAHSWVAEHCYPASYLLNEVQYAILLQAARWWKRRQSPEGVAGFSDFGAVRISAVDVDVRMLLEHHLDMCREGVA